MPNEAEYYAPTLDEILGQWVADAFRDCHRRPEETEHLPIGALRDAADRAIAAHDRALREQIARDIEQHYLGPDAGRRFDGRDAPDAAEMEAFDEGLQFAARIARGEDQTDE